MIGRSLKTRLVFGLAGTQTLAIMLAMLVMPLVAPFTSFENIADVTFRARIDSSIVRGVGGDLEVQERASLAEYKAARPSARFAVLDIDSGKVLKGSDVALGLRLRSLAPLFPQADSNLVTALSGTKSKVIITTVDGRGSSLVFATVGNVFQLEDLPGFLALFLLVIVPVYGPVILGVAVLLPLVIWVVTRPLQKLGEEAARITPGTLDLRLDESGLSSELQALVRSINSAIGRVEEGVRHQRIYAANAAHELRTPVAILGLHIEELSDGPIKAKARADLSRIATLVEQLVTVARLGQTHVAMDERIDVVELARNIIADRAPLAIRNGREIEFVDAVDHHVVTGNRQALASAIANVIENAVRAEPAGGSVVVRAAAGGVLDVVDHGQGVPHEHRALVFEPFWRRSDSTSGAGLGLAIVKEIADRHGITVEIRETAGGGATFRFQFKSLSV